MTNYANAAVGGIALLDDLPPAGEAPTVGHNGGPQVDPGLENMQRAAELSATAFRQAYDECARRAVQAAQANLRRAQEDLTMAEAFAESLRSHGDSVASKLEDGFRRAGKIAGQLEAARSFVEE